MNDELAGKPIDAGWNRSVGRKDRPRAGEFECGVEVNATLHVLPDPLQTKEPGMTFVGVVHAGRWCARDSAVGADGAYAAHTEEHLLLQPMVGTTAVQPVGDFSLITVVLLDIGIQHQQRHPAHLR